MPCRDSHRERTQRDRPTSGTRRVPDALSHTSSRRHHRERRDQPAGGGCRSFGPPSRARLARCVSNEIAVERTTVGRSRRRRQRQRPARQAGSRDPCHVDYPRRAVSCLRLPGRIPHPTLGNWDDTGDRTVRDRGAARSWPWGGHERALRRIGKSSECSAIRWIHRQTSCGDRMPSGLCESVRLA